MQCPNYASWKFSCQMHLSIAPTSENEWWCSSEIVKCTRRIDLVYKYFSNITRFEGTEKQNWSSISIILTVGLPKEEMWPTDLLHIASVDLSLLQYFRAGTAMPCQSAKTHLHVPLVRHSICLFCCLGCWITMVSYECLLCCWGLVTLESSVGVNSVVCL